MMVVVIDASTPEEKPERRRFATMPSELHRLLLWLREHGVEEAVMESTAQYWRSVWLELEPHLRLHHTCRKLTKVLKTRTGYPRLEMREGKHFLRALSAEVSSAGRRARSLPSRFSAIDEPLSEVFEVGVRE
jgi:hypothetical protein